MNQIKQKWLDAMGSISYDTDYGQATLIDRFSYDDFSGELYLQKNGNGTNQRVMILFPKAAEGASPAVAVPFYFPEAMLGFNPKTDEKLENYEGIEMMLHLVKRGYVTACADSFHLTYIKSDKEIRDFTRWQDAADELLKNHQNFTGMGKLFYDTELLIDILASDSRVDSSRIAIAGHSLGGKMAFYAGCLDERICAILASDFGIGWGQTNWNDDWYWGKKLEKIISEGMDHSQLLSLAAPKPFCLIAGKYDDESSKDLMMSASGYEKDDERLCFINHATGHRPPSWALDMGYDFLDKWVKIKR